MKNLAGILSQKRVKRVFMTAALFLGLVSGISLVVAVPLKIQLPPETGTFKPASGANGDLQASVANAQCLTCHSVEYVQMQPPKPLDFWTAEVKKMREKYGAQFPAEDTPSLADYLARTYGTATNSLAPVSPATNSMTALNLGNIGADALATKFGCLGCHKTDVKLVGPAFKDIAAKYRNDPAALNKISQQIHNGGSGKWGPAIMPPYHALVTDDQAESLGKWILSQDTAKP